MAPAAPVVVNDDATIRTSVNSILSNYSGVTADVQNGTVTLRGTIKRDNLQKLMMSLNESNIKNVNNQLTVNN
jgi:osmotically-inducible protein OsmY